MFVKEHHCLFADGLLRKRHENPFFLRYLLFVHDQPALRHSDYTMAQGCGTLGICIMWATDMVQLVDI